jgi:formylmethanofuran--tetrahydromethanopterin N-formyltransferase
MQLGPTTILDTYAEAFAARWTRLVVTAADDYWFAAALREATGYGTSVIGCDAEVGVERMLTARETPDGRPGATVLLFAFSTEKLAQAAAGRVGQCIMTCPTTACYNGLPDTVETLRLGAYLRYFGDGYESREQGAGGRETPARWRVPVMDGEFIVDDVAGVATGIAGGNLILQATSQSVALAAARRAAGAVAPLLGTITPFPGGVVRCGSKVGSKYKNLVASTAETYCPTLRAEVDTKLVDGAKCAYEIVIDGVDRPAVAAAMRAAIQAAAGEGVLAIGAGNYGGRLGKHQFHLHELLTTA